MSWDAYTSNLIAQRTIHKAAIHGHDGSTWASSPGFSLKGPEIQGLLAAYTDPSGIRANGLPVGGIKYIALKCDDRSIYGKKGQGGVIAVKTKQAVLIGVYDEMDPPVAPGSAAKSVETLADYLIGAGYVSYMSF
ncbi:hypothetical protein HK098_007267 [Nowakowskiella sp. JEL0407]|nr:hypothetical protein HK098_007267 [Nowakowskiella sp. JEL0407]